MERAIEMLKSVEIDLKSYEPVGQLFTIGDKMMHIYTGGSGDSTVLFAAGWGTANPYVEFYPLYKVVDGDKPVIIVNEIFKMVD